MTRQVPKLDPQAIYWLEDPDQRLVPSIAGAVEYFDDRPEFRYRDTQRPHQKFVRYESGDLTRGALFRGTDTSRLIVRTLDLPTFERVFRPLTHAAPKFASDAELQAFYRRLVLTDAV